MGRLKAIGVQVAKLTERQAAILDEIRMHHGFASVNTLATSHRVSVMTIRRDLAELEADGQLVRTHGGARLPQQSLLLVEPPFLARQSDRHEEKRRIARAAARLAEGVSTVGVDTGTTALAVCDELARMPQLTVSTPSITVAARLANTATVYLPGGRIRPDELSMVGAQASEGLSRIHVDVLFLGAAALDSECASEYSLEDCETKITLIQQASRVVLLCDSAKFGRRAAGRICDLSALDVLVTDAEPPQDVRRGLDQHDVEVIIADEASETER